MRFTLAALALAALAPHVAGHGFIKDVTVNGQTTKAQKTDIKQSSFRSAPDNTGWIGSNFLSSKCTVCGCSTTPFNTVAAPSGTVFSDAGQSAGQTPSVAAGDSITLHVAGNPGQGWPHPNGHLQAYLASCGASCDNFDASTGNFFKIQGLKNGVPAMRATFNAGADSNSWPVQIPKAVASGKYILRAEITAYGQSSSAEGNQVQFYPFCMNVEVTGGGSANPATVKFPDAIANDKNIVSQGQNYLPGPEVNALFGGTGTGTGGTSPAPSPPVSSPPASSPPASSPPASSNTNSNSGKDKTVEKGTGNGSNSNNVAVSPAPAANDSSPKKCAAGSGKKAKSKGRNGHRRHHRHHHAKTDTK